MGKGGWGAGGERGGGRETRPKEPTVKLLRLEIGQAGSLPNGATPVTIVEDVSFRGDNVLVTVVDYVCECKYLTVHAETKLVELKHKLYVLTGCQLDCQRLRVPLFGPEAGERYQLATLALAQRRLALAKTLHHRLCPLAGVIPVSDIVAEIGTAAPLQRVCMDLNVYSMYDNLGRLGLIDALPCTIELSNRSLSPQISSAQATTTRLEHLKDSIDICASALVDVDRYCVVLIIGEVLIETGTAVRKGDIVLGLGILGMVAVLLGTAGCLSSCRKCSDRGIRINIVDGVIWWLLLFLAMQGGRIYGAGRGCPLSFDGGTNLNGDELRKLCGHDSMSGRLVPATSCESGYTSQYSDDCADCLENPSTADLWRTPNTRNPEFGSMSGCAAAFAPGIVGGLISFCFIFCGVSGARNALKSELRQLGHARTSDQGAAVSEGHADRCVIDVDRPVLPENDPESTAQALLGPRSSAALAQLR